MSGGSVRLLFLPCADVSSGKKFFMVSAGSLRFFAPVKSDSRENEGEHVLLPNVARGVRLFSKCARRNERQCLCSTIIQVEVRRVRIQEA